ncbi:hypothetical protein [Amycolatopsis sp. NPDC052450]|uniref:hypothetical protein n=1 Tax=Amycolatopsis sp. NPDC052450 TaxID=3363937 RepID=UPI0037C735D0
MTGTHHPHTNPDRLVGKPWDSSAGEGWAVPFESFFVRLLGMSVPALLVTAGILLLIFLAGWLTQRQQLHNGKGAPFKIRLPFYHVESGKPDEPEPPEKPGA